MELSSLSALDISLAGLIGVQGRRRRAAPPARRSLRIATRSNIVKLATLEHPELTTKERPFMVWDPMRRRSLLVLLLGSAAACASPEAADRGEQPIRDLLARQARAWNDHDARAWCAPFTEDAEFVNILGMLLQGRAQIEARHAELFRGIFSRSQVTVTTRKVVALGPTVALAETVHELRGYDRLPPGIRASEADGTLRTRLKYVLLLGADGWRIRSAQNTAVLPLPPR